MTVLRRRVSVVPECYSPIAMEAATWTAIGLLAATSLGSLFYLGSRIDALGARLDARMDAQGAELGTRIDALASRLDARIDAQGAELGSRIDALTVKMEDHLRRHAG